MLGSGRPFSLELLNCRKGLPTQAQLAMLEQQLNDVGTCNIRGEQLMCLWVVRSQAVSSLLLSIFWLG